ncbi:MAG: glycosyltransferase family 2 protein [Candidatus Nealsonbacteria bacterium]
MKLLIVIPAYNEEENIGFVIEKIPRSIEGVSEIKILVVDDGSTDNTARMSKEKGAVVVSHQKNKGLGLAFRTGIEESLKFKADLIVNIDADGQFDPNDIQKLISPILKGEADMVTATRFKNSTPQIPLFKKWGNKLFTGLVNFLTKEHFTDTQCGFRAYSKEAVLHLNLFGRFTYTQEVFICLLNKGIAIKEVPVEVKYQKGRKAKISSSLPLYFIKAIVIIFQTFRDYKPLIFFGLPGLIIFGAGFGFGLYSFIYFLITSQTTPVRMYFFVGVALITFGFLLIILALIADMLRRIRQNQEEILYKLKKKEQDQ